MVWRIGRPLSLWPVAIALVATLAMAEPVLAQAGVLKGIVRDAKGQPVEGAVVTMVSAANGRKFTVKTNSRGEFVQIGLGSGAYSVEAEKDKLASPKTNVSAPASIEIVLGAAAAAPPAMDKELQKVFTEGLAASNAGRYDEAIEKFNQAATLNPKCFDCQNNIGFAHVQKKEYDKAEAAYKMAAQIAPEDAAAFRGLATLYNAQRKFDLAGEASAKATALSTSLSAPGGPSAGAEALYNEGVILWNGGKIAEATTKFQAAIEANPDHAEAHFQLGMALVSGGAAGAAAEFETYLKLAPAGPNAAIATSLLGQLKK